MNLFFSEASDVPRDDLCVQCIGHVLQEFGLDGHLMPRGLASAHERQLCS